LLYVDSNIFIYPIIYNETVIREAKSVRVASRFSFSLGKKLSCERWLCRRNYDSSFYELV